MPTELSLELAAIIQYIDLEDMTDSSVKSMLSVQLQQKKKANNVWGYLN